MTFTSIPALLIVGQRRFPHLRELRLFLHQTNDGQSAGERFLQNLHQFVGDPACHNIFNGFSHIGMAKFPLQQTVKRLDRIAIGKRQVVKQLSQMLLPCRTGKTFRSFPVETSPAFVPLLMAERMIEAVNATISSKASEGD